MASIDPRTQGGANDRSNPGEENPLMALVDAASSIYDKDSSLRTSAKNQGGANGKGGDSPDDPRGSDKSVLGPLTKGVVAKASQPQGGSGSRTSTPPLVVPTPARELFATAGPGGTVPAALLERGRNSGGKSPASSEQSSPSPFTLLPTSNARRSLGKNGVPKRTFAEQLMEALDDPANEDVLAWTPDGTAFQITNPRYFTQHLMPNTFHIRNMSSFVRKLGRWGFTRVHESSTRNSDIFRHPKFIRGEHVKCAKIKCVGGSGSTSIASQQAINEATKFMRAGGYYGQQNLRGRAQYDGVAGAAAFSGPGSAAAAAQCMMSAGGMAGRDMMMTNDAAFLQREAMNRPMDIYETHGTMFQRPPSSLSSGPISPGSAEARKLALQQRSLRYAEEEIMQNRISEVERMQNRLRNGRMNQAPADPLRSHMNYASNVPANFGYRGDFGHDPVSTMTTQVLSAAMDALRRDNENSGLSVGPLPHSSHRMFDEMRTRDQSIYAAQLLRERQMVQHQTERFRREMEQSNYYRQLAGEDPEMVFRLLHERHQKRQMQQEKHQYMQGGQHAIHRETQQQPQQLEQVLKQELKEEEEEEELAAKSPKTE